jgi:hypothetical protein
MVFLAEDGLLSILRPIRHGEIRRESKKGWFRSITNSLNEIYLELVLAPLYNLLWKKGKPSGELELISPGT